MDRTVPTSTDRNEPVYPVPMPPDDGRFSHALIGDVAAVLAKHGYPTVEVASSDWIRLMLALHGFLHRPAAIAAAPIADELIYGHDRIDNGDEPRAVPTGVDGESMTGRPVSGAPTGAAPQRQFCRKGAHSCIPALTLTFEGDATRLHWCADHVADANPYWANSDWYQRAHAEALAEEAARQASKKKRT